MSFWTKIKNFFSSIFKKKVPKKEKLSLRKIRQEDPYPLRQAIQLLGEAEIPGAKHNPIIVEMHQYTTLKAKTDEVPWCSSFVNYCMALVGMKGTNLANAQSWLDWGTPTDTPKRGDIVVIKRGSKSWMGHVFFYLDEDDNNFIGLGGNQSDMVSIDKFPKSKLLGIRTYP